MQIEQIHFQQNTSWMYNSLKVSTKLWEGSDNFYKSIERNSASLNLFNIDSKRGPEEFQHQRFLTKNKSFGQKFFLLNSVQILFIKTL